MSLITQGYSDSGDSPILQGYDPSSSGTTAALGAAAPPASIAFTGDVGAPSVSATLAASATAPSLDVGAIVGFGISGSLAASALSPALDLEGNSGIGITAALGAAAVQPRIGTEAANQAPRFAGSFGLVATPPAVALAALVSDLSSLAASASAASVAFAAAVVEPGISASFAIIAGPAGIQSVALNGALLDLKQSIVKELLLNTSFAGIAGLNVYPNNIPQTAVLPAVSMGFHDSAFHMKLEGATGMRSTLVNFEVECLSESDVETISKIIRGWVGFIGWLQTIYVSFVTYEGEIDGYYDPVEGSDQGTHFKAFRLLFKYRENLSTPP